MALHRDSVPSVVTRPRSPTAKKKIPGASYIMFYGVLDDHRDGDGEALVQLEDEVIIEAAQPGRRVAPARDHVFGVKGHSLRAEHGRTPGGGSRPGA